MPTSILKQSPRKQVRTPSKPSRLAPLESLNLAAIDHSDKTIEQTNHPDQTLNNPPADKKSICLSLLTEGYIHSHTDFFYLTHKQESTEQTATQSNTQSNGQSTSQSKKRPSTKEKADTSNQIPPLSSNDLILLSNLLKQAEQADRNGDSITIIDCFTQLSKFFKNRREFRSAIYFTEKILEFTSNISDDQPNDQTSNMQMESLTALRMLAELFAECGESSQSIAMYEKCSTLASDQSINQSISHSNNASLAATLSGAASQLTAAYCQHGDRLFLQGAFEEAVTFYDKCRVKAQQAGQSESEMIALYALGATHSKLASLNRSVEDRTIQSPVLRSPTNASLPSTPQTRNITSPSISSTISQPILNQTVSQSIKDAMNFYQQGLAIAKQLHHSAMIAELSLALADNYTLQNEQNLALNYLELAVYHAGHAMEKQSNKHTNNSQTPSLSTNVSAPSQVLTRSTDFQRLFRGWQCMGEIHSRAQNHVQAAEMFEKSFELARKHESQALMDLARIHVGMARANVAMKSWMALCQQPDVADMLEFKAKRIWPAGLQPPKVAS